MKYLFLIIITCIVIVGIHADVLYEYNPTSQVVHNHTFESDINTQVANMFVSNPDFILHLCAPWSVFHRFSMQVFQEFYQNRTVKNIPIYQYDYYDWTPDSSLLNKILSFAGKNEVNQGKYRAIVYFIKGGKIVRGEFNVVTTGGYNYLEYYSKQIYQTYLSGNKWYAN
jgi:hypothetical protein